MRFIFSILLLVAAGWFGYALGHSRSEVYRQEVNAVIRETNQATQARLVEIPD